MKRSEIVSESEVLRKYAIQKPKGKSWETLSLVDESALARRDFKAAVASYGRGYVRLIQIDFKSADALSDYDWQLVELHDPFQGKGPPKPKVIAGRERTASTPSAGRSATGRQGRPQSGKKTQNDEQVPLPYPTYVAALLFGALAVAVWLIWFRI